MARVSRVMRLCACNNFEIFLSLFSAKDWFFQNLSSFIRFGRYVFPERVRTTGSVHASARLPFALFAFPLFLNQSRFFGACHDQCVSQPRRKQL
jgi:hypothetical protein